MARRETWTDAKIKALKPRRERDVRADPEMRGHCVRFAASGEKSYVVVARSPHRNAKGKKLQVWATIGPTDHFTLEEARDKAREAIKRIKTGKDAFAPPPPRAGTFENVVGEFAKRHLSRISTGPEVRAAIDREFTSRWRTRPIGEISRRDVIEAIERIADRGTTYAAHHALAYLRGLYNWAIARDVYGLDASPCDRIRPGKLIGERTERTRTLTDAELRAVWAASERLGYPFGPFIKLLVLTGQRRDEVADASWSEVDFGKALWSIPGERMKMASPHLVPLSPDAVRLLESLPRFNAGDYVFSTNGGQRPISGFSRMKGRLDALAGVESWRLHDLRRTMRTHLSALPVQDIVRELVIAHTKPGLHKVYDQHLYLSEKRQALELWAARLKAIVEPPPDNVVRFEERRG